MNTPEDDRLQSAFDAARNNAQHLPTPEQQVRARAQFLAEAHASRVSPNGDMRLRDQTGALSDLTLIEGERRMNRFYSRQTRLIAAVLLGAILAGSFWASPSLRALAQTVIDFFTPRSTDTQSGSVFAGGEAPPSEPVRPYPLSLDELVAQADFDVRIPGFMPEQYNFGGASYRSAMHYAEMIFYCPIAPWSLMIVQRQIDEPDPPMEVGASAIIEDVPIRDTMGQYVRGMWETRVDEALIPTPGGEVQELPSTRVWTNDSEWQSLVWREDGINFMISTGSGTMGNDTPSLCALTKADYVAIAEGIQPASQLEK